MFSWFYNQYKWGSPYSPSNRERRLLVLDSFTPHKATSLKHRKVHTGKVAQKAAANEQLRRQIKDEFESLNVTISIILRGRTTYI